MKKERTYNLYNLEIRKNIPEIKEKDFYRFRKIPQNPFKSGEVYSKKIGYIGKVRAVSSYVNPQKEKDKDFMYYNSLQGQIYSSGLISLIDGIFQYLKKDKSKAKIDFVRVQQLENPDKVKNIEDMVKKQWEWNNKVLTYTTNTESGKKVIQVPENFREYQLFLKLTK
jgi:hypothetical protein